MPRQADPPIRLRVRGAVAADAKTLENLLWEVYSPFLDRFRPTALERGTATISDAPSSWLLAETEGTIVGCVRHYPDDDVGTYTFCFLAVREQWRRRGIGSRLVQEVATRAESADAKRILIAVRLSLAENVAFFGTCGFAYHGPFETDEHGLFIRRVEATR